MFNLKIENARGQKFTLTNKESEYQILNIDGLNPPKAAIQSAKVAGMDGSRFASSLLEERNVVITIKINGDVEANRLYLYNYFRTKQYCKIYYENSRRNVYAEGHVETIECGLFDNGQKMQVSIICNDPYWKDIEEMIFDISQVVGVFEFPFAFGGDGVIDPTDTDEAIEFSYINKDNYVNVFNESDDESGFIIEITALGEVTNPVIYSVDTNESICVNTTLDAGDVLTINSNKGEKSIICKHNGDDINYLRYLDRTSSWLKLRIGDNQFILDAESGSELMQVLFKHRMKYEGV